MRPSVIITNVASNKNERLCSHARPRKWPVKPYKRTYTRSPAAAITKNCFFDKRIDPERIFISGPIAVINLLKKIREKENVFVVVESRM